MISLRFNDYAHEPIPLTKRKGWLSLSLIWIGGGIDLVGILLGGQLAMGLPLKEAIISVIIGSLILVLVGSLCSYVGYKTSLSTAMLSRFVFGEYGGRLIAIIIGITGLGWFGVQTGFFGITGQVILYEWIGLELPIWLIALIGGLLMMITAVIGYRAIELLSFWTVPIMVGILVALAFAVLPDRAWDTMFQYHVENNSLSLGFAISLVAGIYIVGAIASPDVARWARTTRDAIIAPIVGFFVGNSLMLFIAVIIAKASGTEELVKVMFTIGWGGFAIFLFVFGAWTTNDNGLYSTGLALSVVFDKIPKHILTLIAGLIGTLLAVVGIYNQFIPFLTILSAFVAPIAGIYTVEFFLLDRNRFQLAHLRKNKIPPLYWKTIVVWCVATLIGMSTSPKEEYGFELFTLTQIPALDAILAGAILQFIVGKFIIPRGKETPLST